MKTENQLEEERIAISARFADAALMAATAFSRLVNLVEMFVKRVVDDADREKTEGKRVC